MFFIINSAFPSVGWYYGSALQPPARGCQKKKKLRKDLDNNFTKNLQNFLSKKFTTKLFKVIICGRES